MKGIASKAIVMGIRQIKYVFLPPSLSAKTPIESLPKILEKPIIDKSHINDIEKFYKSNQGASDSFMNQMANNNFLELNNK